MDNVFFKDRNFFYNILCFLIAENEKLFDRSDARLYWRTVYNIFGVIHHAYVGSYAVHLDLKSSSNVDVDNLYRYDAAYLTGWNFAFQTCFLSMSLSYDLLEWTKKHKTKFGKRLKFHTDLLFSGVVVPITMFISTMFWTVYWIDRELVYPKVYDQHVPWWFNHCVHTNILIVIGLETVLQARRYPASLKVELWMNGIVNVLYAVVYYSIYFCTERWLYGVFGIMSWWQICLYQLLIWLSTFFFYSIQFPINRLFHREKSSKDTQKIASQELEHTKNTMFSDTWSLKFRSKGNIDNTAL